MVKFISSINDFNNRGIFFCYACLSFLLGVFLTVSTALTSIFAVMLLCLFFFGDYKSKFLLIKRYYVWPALLLFLISIISCFYSSVPFNEAFLEAIKFYKLLFIWIIAYICYKYPTIVNKLFIAFLIGVLINVIFIVINYYFFNPKEAIYFSGGNFPAAQSHFVTGLIFAISGFFFLSLAFSVNRVRLKLTFFMCAIILFYVDLVLNTSRTGYVIEFCILFVGFVLKFRFKGILVATALLPIIFLFFYNYSSSFKMRVDMAYFNTTSYFEKTLNNADTKEDNSEYIRLNYYNTVLGVIQNKPGLFFYGCGSGGQIPCTKALIEQYNVNGVHNNYLVIKNPHNQYLFYLLQSGFLSFILFIFLLLSTFYNAYNLALIERNNVRILIVAFSVGCLFNSWLLDIGPGFVFCFLLPIFLSGNSMTEYLCDKKHHKLLS